MWSNEKSARAIVINGKESGFLTLRQACGHDFGCASAQNDDIGSFVILSEAKDLLT